jgi:hypothetical protein
MAAGRFARNHDPIDIDVISLRLRRNISQSASFVPAAQNPPCMKIIVGCGVFCPRR